MADRIESLLPWIVLASSGFVPLAYWHDSKASNIDEIERQELKRALLVSSGSYAVLILGTLAAVVLQAHPESLWLLELSCLFAFILAIIGIVTGAMASGWTRITAVISSAILIGALVFSMSRCDL